MTSCRRAAVALLAGVALSGTLESSGAAASSSGRPLATAQRLEVLVPASIDPTGRDDVSVAMNAFFASVPDDTTVRLQPRAVYRMEQPLVLADRRGLTVDGDGATTFASTPGDRTRSHWVIRRGAGVRITDLVVRGANPKAGTSSEAYQVDKEAQHGFQLDGAQDVELDRVTVTDVYGDFVYLGRDTGGAWTARVWIHDSEFSRTGRQGIAVTSGRDVVIERNRISGTRHATIDLEPNSPEGGAVNIFVLHNEVGPGRLLFLAAHGRGPVEGVVIAGNVLRGRPLSISVLPPGATRRRGYFIVDNRSDVPYTRVSMRFTGIDGLLVRGNEQVVTRDDVGVVATAVCGLTVANNRFGPGVRAVDTGPACGEPPASLPAAPALVGRSDGLPADTPPDRRTPVPDDPRMAPPPAPEQPATRSTTEEGDSTWSDRALPAVLATIAVVTIVGTWVARRRRSQARATHRRVPSGPP